MNTADKKLTEKFLNIAFNPTTNTNEAEVAFRKARQKLGGRVPSVGPVMSSDSFSADYQTSFKLTVTKHSSGVGLLSMIMIMCSKADVMISKAAYGNETKNSIELELTIKGKKNYVIAVNESLDEYIMKSNKRNRRNKGWF